MGGTSVCRARLAVLLLATAGIAPAYARIPEWSLRDYVHTTWTHRDGIALAPIGDMVQTTDGYLWFISQRMLVRFDGIRFLPIPVPCDRVGSLETGDNGALWVLCREPRIQLFQRTALGQLTEVSLAGLRLTGGPSLFRDSRKRLWIIRNVVAHLDPDGSLRQVPGPFDEGVLSPVEDSEGTLWLSGAAARVFRIRDGRVEELPIQRVMGMTSAPTGGVFACGPADRVRYLKGSADTVIVRAPPKVAFLDASHCMAVDAAGRLWVGTRQHGIALVQQGRVETFLSRNEMGASIGRVFIDREDSIWVASSAGLHRYRKPHAQLLSSAVAEMPPNPGVRIRRLA